MTTPKATLAALRKHALTYPEATEEFPWGDRTIKVRGRMAERDGQKVLYNPYYELQSPVS